MSGNGSSNDGKREKTDIANMIGELNGGQVEQMLNLALSDAALNTLTHDKVSTVTLQLKMTRIGDSNQVGVVSTVSYKVPTKRGSRSEDYATDTPMFVGAGGKLSVTPDNQIDIFKNRTRAEDERREADEIRGRHPQH